MKIRCAYRITHIDNIPHILSAGIVSSGSPKASSHYVSIGDQTAIDTRKMRQLDNGTYIGDYIPFYFGPRSPMLYIIQHGYHGVKKVSAQDIVYCVVMLEDLIKSNIECIFTDGHALNKITRIYDGALLRDVDKYISYESVYEKQWSEEDKKRKKEAELLVRKDLSPDFIRYFLVYNEDAKTMLLQHGVEESRIRITPDFYY